MLDNFTTALHLNSVPHRCQEEEKRANIIYELI